MKSIKSVLVLLLALITIIIFVAQSAFSFTQMKRIVLDEEQGKLRLQVEKEASQFYGTLDRIGKLTETLTYPISFAAPGDIGKLEGAVTGIVGSDSLIVGGGFWMEPNALDPTKRMLARYALNNKGEVKIDPQYNDESYNYLEEDWYKAGLVDKKYVWTEPYVDAVSKVPMTTAVSAIRKNGKIIGVTTMDVALADLSKRIQELKVGQTGYGFIISASGTYVSHRDSAKNMAAKITDSSEEGLNQLGKTILEAKEPGMSTTTIGGNENLVTYSPIGDTGLTLVTVLPTAEIMGPIDRLFSTSLTIFAVSIVVFLIVLYWFINRQVAKPLLQLKQGIDKLVEERDLTKQIAIHRKDEIGSVASSLNRFIAELLGIIRTINDSALHVDDVSQQSSEKASEAKVAFNQVAASFQDVASGMDNQQHSAEESARAMEEMAIGIQRVAEASSTLAESSAEMAEYTEAGNGSIQKMMAQMSAIHHSVSHSTQIVNSLYSRSQEISHIAEVIASIASQTNLLALNAAIEAARAGEQGRGFAVVADEVRKLAEQSNAQASQIGRLIAEIQTETASAVSAMDEGTREVHTGISVAQDTGETFRKIETSTRFVADQIQEITAVAEEMSAATEQVTASIVELSTISKASASSASNAAASAGNQLESMRELSHSATDLSDLAKELRETVSKFRV